VLGQFEAVKEKIWLELQVEPHPHPGPLPDPHPEGEGIRDEELSLREKE
jgi:hypothetical protein